MVNKSYVLPPFSRRAIAILHVITFNWPILLAIPFRDVRHRTWSQLKLPGKTTPLPALDRESERVKPHGGLPVYFLNHDGSENAPNFRRAIVRKKSKPNSFACAITLPSDEKIALENTTTVYEFWNKNSRITFSIPDLLVNKRPRYIVYEGNSHLHIVWPI